MDTTDESRKKFYETQIAASVVAARSRQDFAAVRVLMGGFTSPASTLRGFMNLAEFALRELAATEDGETMETMAQQAAVLAARAEADLELLPDP